MFDFNFWVCVIVGLLSFTVSFVWSQNRVNWLVASLVRDLLKCNDDNTSQAIVNKFLVFLSTNKDATDIAKQLFTSLNNLSSNIPEQIGQKTSDSLWQIISIINASPFDFPKNTLDVLHKLFLAISFKTIPEEANSAIDYLLAIMQKSFVRPNFICRRLILSADRLFEYSYIDEDNFFEPLKKIGLKEPLTQKRIFDSLIRIIKDKGSDSLAVSMLISKLGIYFDAAISKDDTLCILDASGHFIFHSYKEKIIAVINSLDDKCAWQFVNFCLELDRDCVINWKIRGIHYNPDTSDTTTIVQNMEIFEKNIGFLSNILQLYQGRRDEKGATEKPYSSFAAVMDMCSGREIFRCLEKPQMNNEGADIRLPPVINGIIAAYSDLLADGDDEKLIEQAVSYTSMQH
jgi:hypothetical protein